MVRLFLVFGWRFAPNLAALGECVEQKLCPDPYTAAASHTGMEVATSIDF
jgi:hypothetical protein